jgi:hypothetical protein
MQPSVAGSLSGLIGGFFTGFPKKPAVQWFLSGSIAYRSFR